MPHLTKTFADFQAAIGEDFVLTGAAFLRACATATFPTSQSVFAVLQPATTPEVSACLHIAQRDGVPIYPISRGRNWGLGSRVPTRSAVLLDLSRLNHIVDCDENFGSLTVEPGVTFQQVHDFLTGRKSRWFLPTIGGPPDASVIGNFVERGDGIGPHADRLANIASLEVVLPNGQVITTGYERFGDTKLSTLSPTPAGPSVHGLFTQSNLGVVTRATVFLARHPTDLQLVSSVIPRSYLVPFIDALRELHHILGPNILFSLWNSEKVNSSRDPAEVVSGDYWFSHGTLYAQDPSIAAAWKNIALQMLSPYAAVKVLTPETLADSPELVQLRLGGPQASNLRSIYSGTSRPMAEGEPDPHRDRCGVLWLCPEVPFEGAAVAGLVELCGEIYRAHHLAPVIGMSAFSPRTFRVFLSIFYDREIPGADENAIRCHDALLNALQAKGLSFFRLGLPSMSITNSADNAFWQMIRQIKERLDPAGILAPGRYD